MSRSAAGQNARPTTAACWSARFSGGASASMRAARTARTVFGMPGSADASARWRTSSCTKNGLPSAEATTRAASARSAPGSSSSTSSPASLRVSGSIASCDMPGR
jgi:hypothetical protein